MKDIKEIRAISGMSQAKFSKAYGIPERTLSSWEAGERKCPSYISSLLERVVVADQKEVVFSCYDDDILKEIGRLYRELLFILNKEGHDPFGNSEVFPTKYFTIALVRAMPLGVPDELNAQIARLMDCVDPDDWANSMSVPVPVNKRQFFLMAKMGYWT